MSYLQRISSHTVMDKLAQLPSIESAEDGVGKLGVSVVGSLRKNCILDYVSSKRIKSLTGDSIMDKMSPKSTSNAWHHGSALQW